ncbi:hypothetical protein MBLNU457_5079t1 [Dothideomycetes sp. NU457]
MDNSNQLKRKATDAQDSSDKRLKTKKQWRVTHKNSNADAYRHRAIQPGDAGIWATCTKGKERKCIYELRDLFIEYAELLYGEQIATASNPVPGLMDVDSGDGANEGASIVEEADEDANGGTGSIEDEIQAEIAGLRKPSGAAKLFEPILPDMQCVVFFRTSAPVEPVEFVHRIVSDAAADSSKKRTRFTHRLSPISMMGRASEEGLEKVAVEVLKGAFLDEGAVGRKFAIRPTMRNHNVLKRDSVIKQVAAIVARGKDHRVDLKGYDVLILIEVYKNICGMSVVGGDFEQLKRFNLAEIYEPTPKAPKPLEAATGGDPEV